MRKYVVKSSKQKKIKLQERVQISGRKMMTETNLNQKWSD